jgi:hypothetical protein
MTPAGGGLFRLTQFCLSHRSKRALALHCQRRRTGGRLLLDMAKVISALEAATQGSEYLDYAIQHQFGLMKPVPAYTRSVDAAMLLFPEGWSIHRLCRRHDCRGNFTGWLAELYRASDAIIEYPANSLGATAALALCLASMRIHAGLQLSARVDDPAVDRNEPAPSRQTA